jgi:hypothetical protein
MLGWQIDFRLSTMKYRDGVTHFRELPHHLGPNETRSANDEDLHSYDLSSSVRARIWHSSQITASLHRKRLAREIFGEGELWLRDVFD